MVIRKKTSEKIFDILNSNLMILIIIMTVYPLLYVFMASVSESSALIQHRGLLLKPEGFTLKAYEMVFRNPMILKGYTNTAFVVIVGVAVNIFITALGAYFLSRKNVMWQKPIALAIIFTMYFSGGLIPLYLTVQKLSLFNSLWALILPVAVDTFNLIVMRTGFAAIPDSLEESAHIDGASHIQILFRIVFPLAMPVISVMILYYGVYHWNAWFHATLFLRERTLYPIQVILREILIINETDTMMEGVAEIQRNTVAETMKYATIIVATVPILCVYPFLQKYFVKGVMIGAIKG